MSATPAGCDSSASTVMIVRSLYFAGMVLSRRMHVRWPHGGPLVDALRAPGTIPYSGHEEV